MLALVMTAVGMVVPYVTGMLGGYTDPSLTFGVPIVTGAVSAMVFLVIFKYLLKKKSV